ncbi:hypothetical protein [Streptomyces antimycoticus]|uniref:hypothetical protein n=1 Tax=Streptomyces antimycoticus TaxID=68175 RepID=UPI0013753201|nr:hypothetical protein [Streptomyces antimycoticus]
MLRSQLAATARCLWPALGHHRADAAQRSCGLGIVPSAARDMLQVMRAVEACTALLR